MFSCLQEPYKYLIDTKWFRLYHNGSYAKWEISLGRVGHREFSILLRCNDCWIKTIYFSKNKRGVISNDA